jgi:hypothetical protein
MYPGNLWNRNPEKPGTGIKRPVFIAIPEGIPNPQGMILAFYYALINARWMNNFLMC